MFVMRYRAEQCGGLPIEEFIRATGAEGAPIHRCYSCTMSDQPAMRTPVATSGIHPNLADAGRRSGREEIIYISANVFLGTTPDMEDIAATSARWNATSQNPMTSLSVFQYLQTSLYAFSAFPRVNLAIIGCGYVAEFYGKTLGNYPELKLVGVYDRNESNKQAFRRLWPAKKYADLEELLADSAVEMVLNLTNPRVISKYTNAVWRRASTSIPRSRSRWTQWPRSWRNWPGQASNWRARPAVC